MPKIFSVITNRLSCVTVAALPVKGPRTMREQSWKWVSYVQDSEIEALESEEVG